MLLALFFSYRIPAPPPRSPPEESTQWIVLPEPFETLPSDQRFYVAPVDVTDATGAAAVNEPGPQPNDAPPSDAEAVRQLLTASMPAPRISEPGPEGSSSDQATQPGADPFVPQLADLTRMDSLDLARLSELRPDLAVMDLATWMMVRNPIVVRDFMRRRFATDASIPRESTATSVTVWIDERGSVGWSEINQSSGKPELDNLALQLFNEVALFQPARERGVRVPMSAVIWVHFPW